MAANNHRSWKVRAEDFDKPWQVSRYIGKYVKCAICRKASKRRPYGKTDRRVNRVPVPRILPANCNFCKGNAKCCPAWCPEHLPE